MEILLLPVYLGVFFGAIVTIHEIFKRLPWQISAPVISLIFLYFVYACIRAFIDAPLYPPGLDEQPLYNTNRWRD